MMIESVFLIQNSRRHLIPHIYIYMYGCGAVYANMCVLCRGNHETRSVNGWEEHYGDKSFLRQCKVRFSTA
jgi:hypothetical protein